MVNYYEEFGLNAELSGEELCNALFQEKKKWIHRQNANDLEKRQLAEKKIALIEEAAVIFSDKLKKQQYDIKVAKEQKKAGGKAAAQTKEEFEAAAPAQDTSNMTIEEISEKAEELYASGDTRATIEFCRNMLNAGYASKNLTNCLGLALWENDELDAAVEQFKLGAKLYPEEAIFNGNVAAINLHAINNYATAREYLDKALAIDPNNNFLLALDVTYLFYTGEVDAAEEKIKQHVENYPDDVDYKDRIVEVYIGYSDQFLVESGNGGAYIPTLEALNSILYYRKKAKEVRDSDRINELIKVVEDRSKRTFNKDNLKGIGCLVLLGGIFVPKMLVLWVILAAVLAYFSYKPNWLIEKMEMTGQRDIANTVCHGLYVASSYIGRFVLWVFKFALEIIGSL